MQFCRYVETFPLALGMVVESGRGLQSVGGASWPFDEVVMALGAGFWMVRVFGD